MKARSEVSPQIISIIARENSINSCIGVKGTIVIHLSLVFRDLLDFCVFPGLSPALAALSYPLRGAVLSSFKRERRSRPDTERNRPEEWPAAGRAEPAAGVRDQRLRAQNPHWEQTAERYRYHFYFQRSGLRW